MARADLPPSPPEARLTALIALGERLDRSTPEDAPGASLRAVVAELGLTAGWIFLTDTRRGDAREGTLSVAAGHGLPPALAAHDARELRCGSCECQRRFRDGRLDGGTNMVTCSRLAGARGDTAGLELHASVPLRGREGMLGILNLAAPGDRRFAADELAFLEVVGRQLGAALERSRLSEERTRAARVAAALEERQRLAREMHDALAQLLFAAGLQLRSAQAGRAKGLDEAAALLDDARAELRALIETNRSPDLTSGLVPALGRLAERLSAVADVHLEASGRVPSRRAQEALYRCAQEAVHNAVRHGGAGHVRITLRDTEDGGVWLRVADDGRGCDPERVLAGPGVRGLQARAVELGGTIDVSAREGGGLVLDVRLPRTAGAP